MRKLTNKELGRKSITDFKRAEKLPIVIILDNVRSLHNIGSVFRTSDAFLLEGIYLCGISARPPHRDIQKTALGATETVSWEYFDETIKGIAQLKNQDYEILAIEQTEDSMALHDFIPQKKKKYALVFGHEVKGVSQEVIDYCDGCLEIPQIGTKHSLNISVSVGITIWDLYGKLIKQNL
ncbi:MAG TPA: TrmH family RNA methyltransferase [Flavobacteriales bacterium]|nr:TrmH family RNA methyltransferase [Flavobacteriales bacterium]HIN38991.1 TrmH family RNA methyltransferase [Flavobacteriales bacterium]